MQYSGVITRQAFENYHVYQNVIAEKLITCSSITNRGMDEWAVTQSELMHMASKVVVILLERKEVSWSTGFIMAFENG